MKRYLMYAIAALLVVSGSAFAGGDGHGNNVNNDVTTKTKTDQTLIFAPQSNDNRSLGTLPMAETHGIGTAVFPMSDYGHLITEFSKGAVCTRWTRSTFETFTKTLENTPGALKWEEINERIIPFPLNERTYAPLADTAVVYMLEPREIGPIVTADNYVGIWAYDSEYSKRRIYVVPQYFKPRAYLDAVASGANLVVKVDQFAKGHLVPEGYEISFGGLLSWVVKAFTGGGSVAANAGVAMQQNQKVVQPGAAFIFLHVENLPDLCAPPKVETKEEPKLEPKPACDPDPIRKEIAKVEKEIEDCKFWSMHNLILRAKAAYLYGQLYNCTGKTDKALLEKSLFHAKKSQQNYDEVHQHPKSAAVSRENWDEQRAVSVLKTVYWNQAAATRELNGREAEISFARDKGLERMPTSTEEIKEIK